jgi:hypothetical protein
MQLSPALFSKAFAILLLLLLLLLLGPTAAAPRRQQWRALLAPRSRTATASAAKVRSTLL